MDPLLHSKEPNRANRFNARSVRTLAATRNHLRLNTFTYRLTTNYSSNVLAVQPIFQVPIAVQCATLSGCRKNTVVSFISRKCKASRDCGCKQLVHACRLYLRDLRHYNKRETTTLTPSPSRSTTSLLVPARPLATPLQKRAPPARPCLWARDCEAVRCRQLRHKTRGGRNGTVGREREKNANEKGEKAQHLDRKSTQTLVGGMQTR